MQLVSDETKKCRNVFPRPHYVAPLLFFLDNYLTYLKKFIRRVLQTLNKFQSNTRLYNMQPIRMA